METKWSDLGFLGSFLLVLFGIFSLVIIYTPPAAFGTSAPIVAIAMAIFGLVAGFFFSLGFLAFRIELNAPSPWLTYFTILLTIFGWAFYAISQIMVALGFIEGLVFWFYSLFGLMVMTLFWGMAFFSVRNQLGGKARLALGTAVLFLINGLGWLSFMGYGILTLAGFLCLFIFAPAPKFSIFSPLVRFFNEKRVSTIRLWGPLLMTIYFVLAMTWVIDLYFPVPVAAVAVVNFFSLFFGWLCALSITLVLRSYETQFENNTLWFAQLAWVPSMFLFTLGNFQWLMSSLTVGIDYNWAMALYLSKDLFILWGALSMAIFSLITAVGMLQIYRSPEMRGDNLLCLLHLFLLVGSVMWIASYTYFIYGYDALGYGAFALIGLLLWLHARRLGAKA